jgi:hypothetical protein
MLGQRAVILKREIIQSDRADQVEVGEEDMAPTALVLAPAKALNLKLLWDKQLLL